MCACACCRDAFHCPFHCPLGHLATFSLARCHRGWCEGLLQLLLQWEGSPLRRSRVCVCVSSVSRFCLSDPCLLLFTPVLVCVAPFSPCLPPSSTSALAVLCCTWLTTASAPQSLSDFLFTCVFPLCGAPARYARLRTPTPTRTQITVHGHKTRALPVSFSLFGLMVVSSRDPCVLLCRRGRNHTGPHPHERTEPEARTQAPIHAADAFCSLCRVVFVSTCTRLNEMCFVGERLTAEAVRGGEHMRGVLA